LICWYPFWKLAQNPIIFRRGYYANSPFLLLWFRRSQKTDRRLSDVHRFCRETAKRDSHFGTMTVDILSFSDWLTNAGCTHLAMESTGVYWKPIYNLLEGLFEILVVNAQHVKTLPGRKTDVRDAEWIADLLQHGLLRSSFIPSPNQRELRDLTRHRTTLVAERARIVNRLQKVLEDAYIKLASVASDITGASARKMLQALLDGERDASLLAAIAKGRMRSKQALLEQALAGRMREHHAFLIAEHLGHIDYLDESIARFTTEINDRLSKELEEIALLDTIPGISARTAEILLAEIGTDMARFPSAKHLSSWAGMCPGNNESAGKRKTGKTRKGSRWLRQVLTEAAHGAAATKNTYLGALYRRLAPQPRNEKGFGCGRSCHFGHCLPRPQTRRAVSGPGSKLLR